MFLEIAPLLLGLTLLSFHRPIADFVMAKERQTGGFFRDRGINVPEPPSEALAHNIYFGLGTLLCIGSMLRLWMAMQ